MKEELRQILENKALSKIFFELIASPNGLTMNDLINKKHRARTTLSTQINKLVKSGLVKRRVLEDKKLKWIYYPSLKPFFESIARSFNVEFTQEDYDNIDNFLFYPTIKDKVFEISKNTNIENNIIASLPTIIFKVFAFIMSQEFQDMIEKDKQLQELFEKYQKTMSKIPFLNLV